MSICRGILLWCCCVGGSVYGESTLGGLIASFPPFEDTSLQASPPTAQTIVDGTLVLTDSGVAYTSLDARLGDTSLIAEAAFTDDTTEALFLGLRVQKRVPISGYVVDLTRDGNVSLVALVANGDQILATGNAGFSPGNEPFMLCCRIQQQTLSGWVWQKGSDPPSTPTLTAKLFPPVAYTEGLPTLGVRGGSASFTRLEIGGTPFRPRILSTQQLARDIRLKMTWESIPEHIYRIEHTTDRVRWDIFYHIKPTTTAAEAIVVGSFSAKPASSALFRLIDVTGNVEVGRDIAPIVPLSNRYALTWTSAEDRVYGFEWSQDLETWTRYAGIAVPGTDGQTHTETVLPLPGALKNQDASNLYFRVIDLDDDAGYGLLPAANPAP